MGGATGFAPFLGAIACGLGIGSTAEPWAVKLRDQRNIGDFRQWKKPAEYQKSLDWLLRDLKASAGK